MRRGSQDLLSEIGSRPAYLEEFERKLAAAFAQQSDARKARSGSARSSHVDVEVPSSPSLGEAITPGSMGEEKPAKVELPSGKTRKTRAQFSSAEPPRVSPQRDRTDDAAEAPAAGGAVDVHPTQLAEAITPWGGEQPAKVEPPSRETRETGTQFSRAEPTRFSALDAGADDMAKAPAPVGTADVHATELAAPLSGQAETSSAGRALRLRTERKQSSDAGVGVSDKVTQAAANQAAPAVTHALQRGNGKGPAQEMGAAPGPVDSKAQQTIDVEAALATDAEFEEVVKPATRHARPDAKVIKRFSRNWKLTASACALVSLAMVGAVALPHSMLAVPNTLPQNTPPRADEPSVRETITRDDSAEPALKGSALEASSAATPQANVAPGAGATQTTVGLTNGAPSGSTLEPSDPTGPTPLLAPPAQTSALKPAPTDLAATATSALPPPAQSSDLKPVSAASPQPAPTPASATLLIEDSSARHAPQPASETARNVQHAGTAKLSAPRHDGPTKVAGKPSIEASSRNDATSRPAVTERSNQGLPIGTPTNPEKGAMASNVVQSPSPPPAADSASAEQPVYHPTHAARRGGVLSQYPVDPSPRDGTTEKPSRSAPLGMKGAVASNVAQPPPEPPAAGPAASDQQPLDRLRHAIGIFSTGTVPAQHSADPTHHGTAIENSSKPLPLGTPRPTAVAAPASAAAVATPAAPNQINGLY